MHTGNDNNVHKLHAPLATGLRFEKNRVIVELDDQREVSIPLSLYPTLQNARPAQRADWQLIGPGKGFHWQSLDLDLSVCGLIGGLAEMIPAPPRPTSKRRRKPTLQPEVFARR